jgi:predicted DsbA family dithiol-disulfide isomerase
MEPLHIYSDVICPWCFVGKTRLDKAIMRLKAEGGAAPEIVWHPYELDPETPPEGEPMLERLAAKYGAERVAMIHERLDAIGEAEGIPFNGMKNVPRTPNTFKAHRLIAYAQKRGKGDEIAGLLFRAHFLEGRDVGDTATLVKIGQAAGFDAKELEGYYDGSEGVAELRAEEEDAMSSGLRGVPYYLINQHPMYGAQEVDTFLRALKAESGVH